MARFRVPIAALAVALAPYWVAEISAAPLVLNNPTDAPLTTPSGDGFLDRLAREAFRRAGAKVILVSQPAERGMKDADAGTIDGDLNRIAGIEQGYPNLVRVAEKNMDMDFSAFTRRPDASAESWAAFAAYRVGIIRGWKILEANLGGAGSVVYAKDAHQLFLMLEHDRADVVLYSRVMGIAHVRTFHPNGVRVMAPPLVTREMFIYLHRRHAALAVDIARALRAMKTDGTLRRYHDETLGRMERR